MDLSGLDFEELMIDCITEGARAVGHLVTVESCTRHGDFFPELIQFLKKSPIFCSDGKYHAMTNYGCICRSLGSVEDNLTALKLGMTESNFYSLTYAERMDAFVTGVVRGFVHEPSSLLMDALRSRFNYSTDMVFDTISMERHGLPVGAVLNPTYVADEHSICRRYDVTLDQLRTLADDLKIIRVGQIYASSTLGAIYKTDYGLEPVSDQTRPTTFSSDWLDE
jgi:hypothetical protein